jgi:D-beta-D-heptose 7-phosphate kinase/D-beta-D-heptose 1-phosphate adenosyltransferase
MTDIETFLEMNESTRAKVTVVGDYLVDEYYHVLADRVSPEFPIPVMLSPSDVPNISVPGGAGNVCRQMEEFNIDVDFYSLIDTYGLDVLNSSSIGSQSCVLMEGKNPIKKRIYQDDFPLCRWDIESNNFGLPNDVLAKYQKELYEKFCEEASGVVIFSDYGKGLFEGDLNWMCNEDLLTIVDPKNGPIEKWKGCTIFKPNEKEARELSGFKDWKKQCDYFMSVLGCTGVVITCGRKGVVGKMLNGYFKYSPDFSVPCESVIGAGDAFAAFLAMTQTHCMDIVKSVALAWKAGSIYVQKKHNKPVHPYELLALDDPIKAKFVSPYDLKDRDFKLVMTNGVYDFCHFAHISTFEFAKSKGDKLVVLVNSDESVKKLKGNARPIIPLEQRIKMIAALGVVDYVMPFYEDTPNDIIKIIQPDVLVKGMDWQGKMEKPENVNELCFAPLIDGISTTKIIDKIIKSYKNL